jgi:hypothetical protein
MAFFSLAPLCIDLSKSFGGAEAIGPAEFAGGGAGGGGGGILIGKGSFVPLASTRFPCHDV